MRIEIKTKGRVKDKDIRALYVLERGISMSTKRMLRANLKFILTDKRVLAEFPQFTHLLNR